MRYAKFIKSGQKIGICAPSAGVGNKIEDFENALSVLSNQGYKIQETKSVRANNDRSTSGKNRAKELDELVCDKNIDMIMCATGGDYMLEIMPYVNFDNIDKNPKWIMGYSDPTNILYTVTTKLDIATLYGFNASSYGRNSKDEKDNLSIISGKLVKQSSSKKHISFLKEINGETKYDTDTKWLCKQDEITIKGRLIGGCLDCIDKLIGSEFDYTKQFIERYKDDGIVYYFDIFAMTPLSVYLTLLQMHNAGYFKYCKGVLIGRIAIPNIENKKFDYIKAIDKAMGKIPHIMEMDIGHSSPRMTLINGGLIEVNYSKGKGSIKQKLS